MHLERVICAAHIYPRRLYSIVVFINNVVGVIISIQGSMGVLFTKHSRSRWQRLVHQARRLMATAAVHSTYSAGKYIQLHQRRAFLSNENARVVRVQREGTH